MFGGLGDLFKGAIRGLGGLAQSGASAIGSGISNFLGSGGNQGNIQNSSVPGVTTNFLSPQALQQQRQLLNISQPSMGGGMNPMGGGGGGGGNPWGNSFLSAGQLAQQNKLGGWSPKNTTGSGGLGSMFKSALPGLGVMGMGAMIPNSKMPDMPQEFTNYMGQLNAGGTPGMQAADKYYQGVLSGQNKDAYDAAFNSLDLNYQEQLRQLNSMYKSLRPGTDPTSDSTYQRDLAQLNDQYARQRAQVGAQVQQGAASGAVGLGSNLAQMQGGAVQQYLDRIATQWGMNQSQRQALRETIMGLGGKMITGPMDIGNLIAQSKAMKAAMGG